MTMKKIIFIVFTFLLSINIYAKANIRETGWKNKEKICKNQFRKKLWKVETVGDQKVKFIEYYRKNKQQKSYLNIIIF